MTDLTKVPTFTFRQGKISTGTCDESSIQVSYYNGTIELRQEGCFEQDEIITISTKHFDALYKAIKKHLPEAMEWLERKGK